MRHYGNIDLNNNLLHQMVFETELSFPAVATPGRMVFQDKRLFMCAEIQTGFPVWIPLTNELDTFVYADTSPSQVWTITHNLNTTTPMVQVYDTDFLMVIPDNIIVVDNNTVEVDFGDPMAGRAVIMAGSTSGSTRSIYSFVYTQTTSSDTWVISHGLGYYPIVRVFIGNAEIQPLSIVHDSVFQTTITFSTPQVGIARFI